MWNYETMVYSRDGQLAAHVPFLTDTLARDTFQ
jgi:hypothetical protein